MRCLLWFLIACSPVFAELPVCSGAVQYVTCDLGFDLEAGESAATATLQVEFKSPRHKTYLLHSFSDSDRRVTIRFIPNEAGDWEYKITSSIARLNDQGAKFTAGPSDNPGFIHPENLHHFQSDNEKPHLWMGTAIEKFTTIPRADFDSQIEQRAKEKFTHIRVSLESGTNLVEAAERVKAINAKGMIADLAIAAIPSEKGERYVGDVVNRFAAMNIVWMSPAFDAINQGRPLMKTINTIIQRNDPYNHPRTSMAQTTSAPLIGDGWENVISYGTIDPNVGSVEHQFYQRPAINTAIQSSADLWNATMNGQYPDSGSGKYMETWATFMAGNRYWELEPYFDVDGGRAVALDGVEYVVFVETPGIVVLNVEKHNYDVAWINPETGERTKLKNFNAERFIGTPPDNSHSWVLHVSREGHKEGMKSYRFASREIPLVQEIETNPEKIPFDVETPTPGDVSIKTPPLFSLHIKRDNKATRNILVEWTGEVTIAGQGYRVIGRGKDGTLRVPGNLTDRYPASLAVRVLILNANGKAYALDRVYRLTE
jgi:Domain of unknown function (DUF5060)